MVSCWNGARSSTPSGLTTGGNESENVMDANVVLVQKNAMASQSSLALKQNAMPAQRVWVDHVPDLSRLAQEA